MEDGYKKKRDEILTLAPLLRRYIFPILVTMVGISLSAAAFIVTLHYKVDKLEHDFHNYSQSQYTQLVHRFNAYIRGQEIAAGAIASVNALKEEQFFQIISPLFSRGEFAASFLIPSDNKYNDMEFIKLGQDINPKNVPIKNSDAIVNSIEKASKQKKNTVVGPFKFFTGEHNSSDLAFIFPVYDKRHIKGYLVSILDLMKTFSATMNWQDNNEDLSVYVYKNDGDKRRLFYYSDIEGHHFSSTPELSYDNVIRKSPFYREETVELLTCEWKILFVPTQQYLAQAVDFLPWIVLVAGTLVTIVLSMFVFSLVNQNIRIQNIVKMQTIALKRSNEELERFAYVASHDLKAPLRAIDQLSNWLEEDLGPLLDGDNKENMETLRGRVRRMNNLLDSLLEYSRIGVKINNKDNPVIKGSDLITDIKQLLNPPKDFTISADDTFNGLLVYRMPLHQVMLNLINNAIKHHDKDDGHIEVSAKEMNTHYEISVKDDGPGIAEKFHRKIFEMFQTLQPRDKVEGNGMGLALVSKIVTTMNGNIYIESTEGSGAVFRFTWSKIKGRKNNEGK
ncbi:MAG: ATP-binding protein [Rickettsiales bacterium]